MRLDLFSREGVFKLPRYVRYDIGTFRLAVNIFLWLGVIEPSSFCFFLFFSFLIWCSTKLFSPPKYLRPLVPESDIVAGNTNEGGVQDYGTAE